MFQGKSLPHHFDARSGGQGLAVLDVVEQAEVGLVVFAERQPLGQGSNSVGGFAHRNVENGGL